MDYWCCYCVRLPWKAAYQLQYVALVRPSVSPSSHVCVYGDVSFARLLSLLCVVCVLLLQLSAVTAGCQRGRRERREKERETQLCGEQEQWREREWGRVNRVREIEQEKRKERHDVTRHGKGVSVDVYQAPDRSRCRAQPQITRIQRMIEQDQERIEKKLWMKFDVCAKLRLVNDGWIRMKSIG